MKVVIAGGSGALGQRLAAHFEDSGHEVIVLTRRSSNVQHGTAVQWDGKTIGEWQYHLHDAVIINLAGQLVDVRPTAANVEKLRRSRVDTTLVLKQAMANNGWAAPLWLQMSTLAIYGDCGDVVLDESAEPIKPLPQMTGVAVPWEEAFDRAPAQRRVVMRAGIVLDNGTPAMQKLVSITKAGLGGRIAHGDQWISWIHIDDFIRAVQHMIDTPELCGVVHVTSPNPVRNKDLMAALRRELHRPPALPTPSFAVKLGALAMGSDPALALTGRQCTPRRLLESGFVFQWSALDGALSNLLATRVKQPLPSLRAFSQHDQEAMLETALSSRLTYSAVGATNGRMPAAYLHHEFAVIAGVGRDVFERCAAWLDTWGIQRSVGFEVLSSTPRIQMNTTAVLTVQVIGLNVQAPCRVVYVVREANRHGFAYGTLNGHPESGEEYFGVTIDEEGRVRFVLRAFSKPATFMAKLGGPVIRRLQLAAQYRYIQAAAQIAGSGGEIDLP